MSTLFVIEKPGDEYYNIGHWSDDNTHPYPVIEVELFMREKSYEKQPDIDRLSLRVIAPAYIAKKWSTLSPRYFDIVDGPVRNLTYEEYKGLYPNPGRGWSAELLEVCFKVAEESDGK